MENHKSIKNIKLIISDVDGILTNGRIYIDNNNNVKIEMTLTNPNCPVAGIMPENVGKSVSSLDQLSVIPTQLEAGVLYSK